MGASRRQHVCLTRKPRSGQIFSLILSGFAAQASQFALADLGARKSTASTNSLNFMLAGELRAAPYNSPRSFLTGSLPCPTACSTPVPTLVRTTWSTSATVMDSGGRAGNRPDCSPAVSVSTPPLSPPSLLTSGCPAILRRQTSRRLRFPPARGPQTVPRKPEPFGTFPSTRHESLCASTSITAIFQQFDESLGSRA